MEAQNQQIVVAYEALRDTQAQVLVEVLLLVDIRTRVKGT